MSLSCKMSFIYKTGEIKDKTVFFTSSFFYFSDMHLHAYSKASYQTHTNTLCHLHELQIISGTSVQIRTEKQIFPCHGKVKNRIAEKEEPNQSCLLAGGRDSQALQPSSAATKPGDDSVNRLASKYHSRSFLVLFCVLIYLVEVHLSPALRFSPGAEPPSSTDKVSSQNTLKSKCSGEEKKNHSI